MADEGCTSRIVIGNIPHKIAYRTWALENMHEMPAKIKETYPTLPNYTGTQYVFFETAEVREDPGVVEDANGAAADWDDGNNLGAISEDDDSSGSDSD